MERRSAGADLLSRFLGLDLRDCLTEKLSHFLEGRKRHGDSHRFDVLHRAASEFSRGTCHRDQNNTWAFADVDSGDEHWGVVGHLVPRLSSAATLNLVFCSNPEPCNAEIAFWFQSLLSSFS